MRRAGARTGACMNFDVTAVRSGYTRGNAAHVLELRWIHWAPWQCHASGSWQACALSLQQCYQVPRHHCYQSK